MNKLDQLKSMTTIVADTGDLAAIRRLKPIDATTNPSLITKALSEPNQQARLKEALVMYDSVENAIDALTVKIGCDILQLVSGRVSTEVDAKLSYDTGATINKAKQFIASYEKHGFDPARVLIKIAATWQGIQAAKQLEQDGIHCNLTLLFGMHQAKACADAGVTLISPFVGRILDWQKRDTGAESIGIENDLGVRSVTDIYHYYKQHGYNTQIMGASFRSTAQICALAGCDLLTISPMLLDELANETGNLEQRLRNDMEFTPMAQQLDISESEFMASHRSSDMATELLENGIKGFVEAREILAKQLNALK